MSSMRSRLFRALCPRTMCTLPLATLSRFASRATTASLALPPSAAAVTRAVTLSPLTSTLLRPALGCTLMSNSMSCVC